MLHLRLLRQPELRLPELAQLGDVAEHGDHRHRLGRAAGARPPQIGGRDRERARLAAAAHRDHAPLDARPLGRRVDQHLREVVESLPQDEHFGEAPPRRPVRLEAQYALGRRVERLDSSAEADHQHSVLEIFENLAMDLLPRHRPTCSTLIPHRSSVVPSARSSPARELR